MGIIYTLHFFSMQRLKEKNAPLSNHNSWKYELDDANYFLLTLQGLPFMKIIVMYMKTINPQEITSQ